MELIEARRISEEGVGMSSERVDPILLTIIANRLETATREMGAGMLRSSRSPVFAENMDFVTAIFDNQLRLVAQTAFIPVLVGASPFAIKAVSDHFDDDVHEGDVMVVNDPYHGNNHLPDITIVKPVFFEGRLRFWVLAKGHHADIGGGGAGVYNPKAKNIWEEGLRIPPVKLYRRGIYNSDLWNLILLNVRLPVLVEGDLQCQVGACSIGEKTLWQMLQQYGAKNVDAAIEHVLSTSEMQMRARIRDIPDGAYSAVRQLDYIAPENGKRPPVKLSLHVRGDTLHFDFTGTDSEIPIYYNSSYPNTVSSCYIGVFSTIAPDVRVNEGSTRPMSVLAPEGSLVNPREGMPTTRCTVDTCAVIVETVWLALSQAVPSSVQAAWGRANAASGTAFNPRTGRNAAFIFHFTKGGGGATFGFDGWSHISPVSSMGGSRVPDPELHEMTFPHLILEYEYRKDSAGAGQWRGGYGTCFRVQFEDNGTSLSIQIGSGSRETAPFGLIGGLPAVPGRVSVRKASGEITECLETTLYRPAKGDIAEFYSAGGGGYGNPHERPVEAVVGDIAAGLLSVEKAENDYGVVVDPGMLTIDWEATERLRSRAKSLGLSA